MRSYELIGKQIHRTCLISQTYGTESHDLKQPHGERQVQDHDDHQSEHQRVQTPFPPSINT